MRLYTLLKLLIQFIKTGVVSAKGGAQAINTPQHFELINGVKICWGRARFKYNDSITLPYNYEYCAVLAVPVYNTSYSMKCSIGAYADGNKLIFQPYDITTNGTSTYTSLAAYYIVIGV